MKSLHPLCLLAVAVLFGACSPRVEAPSVPSSSAPEFVIGLPQEMDEGSAKTCFGQVLEIITKSSEATRISLINALDRSTIATITVPTLNSVARTNPSARLNRLAKEIALLRSFCQTAAGSRSGKPNRLCFPQFLDRASEIGASSSDLRIVVFGSPFYQADKFAFGPDTWIGDGVLKQRTSENPFGTADRRDSLSPGTAVYFCYLSEAAFSGDGADQVRRAVSRFWNLFVRLQGGTLSAFAGDPEFVTRRALDGVRASVGKDDELGDESPGFVRQSIVVDIVRSGQASMNPEIELLPEGSSDQSPSVPADLRSTDAAPQGVAPHVRESEPAPGSIQIPAPNLPQESAQVAVENALRALPRSNKPGFVNIGAVWASEGAGVDVDLSFSPQGAAAEEELSFRMKTSAAGRYLRDIQQSLDQGSTAQDWNAQWEGIELKSTTLEGAASGSCWLNLYRGGGSPIRGVVRIADGDQQIDLPFAFPGSLTGDCGKGTVQRELNPCWQRVDLRSAVDQLLASPR